MSILAARSGVLAQTNQGAYAFRSGSSANSSGNEVTTTATYPAGWQAGDLLLLACISPTAMPTFPAGWTTINSASGTNINFKLAYRVAQSGDAGTVAITNGTATRGWNMLAYSGSRTPPVDASSQMARGSLSADIVAASVTATRTGKLVVFWATNSGTAYSSVPGSMTFRQNTPGVNNTRIFAADETIAATGATGTRTGVLASSTQYAGALAVVI